MAVEEQLVEREPDPDPRQDEPEMVGNQPFRAVVRLDVGGPRRDHEPDHNEGHSDAQGRDAVEADGPPLPPVVADPVVAVTPKGPRHLLLEAVADLRWRQAYLEADRRPGRAAP